MTEYRIEGVKTCLFIHDDGTSDMFFSYYPKLIGTDFEKEFRQKEMYVFENITVQACITRLTERNLLKRAPILDGKTALVVNGISDISEEEKEETMKIKYSNTSPKYRMVQVGSMNGRKGHREVIEALHRTSKEMLSDIHVTFVGGGYEKQALEELVKEYVIIVDGDANGDAVIDTYDVAYITEVVNSGEDPDALLLKVLDLFKDGYVDAMDVAIMISLANMDATLKQDGSMGTY